MENPKQQEFLTKLRNDIETDVKRQSEKFSSNHKECKDEQLFNSKSQSERLEHKLPESSVNNIFEKKENRQPPVNIFQGHTKSVNLFDISKQTISTTNIFQMQSKPVLKDSDVKSDSGDDNSRVGEEFKTDPEVKEMKYEYKSQFTKIKDYQLKKFRNGARPPKDNVTLVLSHTQKANNIVYLTVRSKETNVIFFEAITMKNIARMQSFMNKEENLKMWVLVSKPQAGDKQESPSSKSTLQKETIKMQFQSGEQCNNFKETVQNFLSRDTQDSNRK